MSDFKLVEPCLLGLEGLVASELKRHGFQNVTPENGRVFFEGSQDDIAKANIISRYGERILILMGRFHAESFTELFDNVKKIKWSEILAPNSAFPVKGSCINSKLASVSDCQSIIKKAIVENMKNRYRIDWFKETGDLYQIQFLIMKDEVSIMIDTSGEPLHKRGYRKKCVLAPLRETIAAAMVDLSYIKNGEMVCDPFCGSGTILIEAAAKMQNIAPGINRNYTAENWKIFNNFTWKKAREMAASVVKKDVCIEAIGYDIDEAAIKTAKANAALANVDRYIKFEKKNIKDYKAEIDNGVVITNPPYGERLLSVTEARELYKILGEKYVENKNWKYTVISPDDLFEECFGFKAKKRRKLYNGMIKCQVYFYF
jgi:putative N6-adenine-specific DNA methylase